jgi:polysaccharide pyruvyl transferase WcaK-like protein
MRNTGMHSVELAAQVFLKGRFPDAELIWYKLDPEQQTPGVMPARLIWDFLDQFFEHDLLLYWGDFLHSDHFIEQDAVPKLRRLLRVRESRARELLCEVLLLQRAPIEILRKSVAFGGSLIHSVDRLEDDSTYAKALRRLIVESAGFFPREPVSAAAVARLRDDSVERVMGCDPAFLLPSTCPSPSSGDCGLFLGARTGLSPGICDFVAELRHASGLRFEWLPWFPQLNMGDRDYRRRLGKLVSSPSQLAPAAMQAHYRRKLMRQAKATHASGATAAAMVEQPALYDLIVTDTYHLCVNALRLGTPCICLGDSNERVLWSLNDKKKAALLSMYSAERFYIQSAQLSPGRSSELVAELLIELRDSQRLETIFSRVRGVSRTAREALATTIAGVLQDRPSPYFDV